MKLMRAPKFALVVGNRSYKRSPLRNPASDARSIGELLKAVEFDVTLKLDASRTELEAAVLYGGEATRCGKRWSQGWP